MIIKLTVEELSALLEYDGPFGERGFLQFMTCLRYKVDEETGEIDIDDEDVRLMNKYSARGHKREIGRIFKRPLDDWHRKFFGEP